MRSYSVIVYGAHSAPPVLHLISAINDAAAVVFADMVFGQSPDGVGVTVTDSDGGCVYAQGKVPDDGARGPMNPRQVGETDGHASGRNRPDRALWRFVVGLVQARA